MNSDLARIQPLFLRLFIWGIVSRFSNISIGSKLGPNTIQTIVSKTYSSKNTDMPERLLGPDLLLKGILNLSHKEIKENKSIYCEISIWRNWFTDMPIVQVSSNSLWKDGNEWHCNKSSGDICYAHLLDWQYDINNFLETSDTHGLYLSGNHLVDLICSLMYRHLSARRSRMENWPSEWGYHPHSDGAARAAFEKEHPKYAWLSQKSPANVLKQYF